MKTITIALPVSLLLFFYALPVLSQQKKTWSLEDRIIIAGILFNPGYGLAYNRKNKECAYDCYFDNQYLNKDSSELFAKAVDFFNFFSFFVMDRKKGVINTATLAMYDLKRHRKYIRGTHFDNVKPDELDANNRMSVLARALFFLVDEFRVDNGTISIECNFDQCPKTISPFNVENYFALFSFVVKDFVLRDNNEFKALNVKCIINGKPKTFYVSFNNKVFNNMYSRKYLESGK